MMRRRNGRRSEGGNGFWQSYADMMAAMLLVTTLVLAGAILQAMTNYEKQKDDLEKANSEVEIYIDSIESLEGEVAGMSNEIASASIEIAGASEEIAQAKGELDEAAGRLQKIIGIKQEIIEQLREAFRDDAQLSIDEETGAIVFDSELLFDKNLSTLKPEGKAFLDRFIPIYMNVLLSDQFMPYVSEIIIEGHADSEGGYIYNLDLSQQRASAVSQYFLSDSANVVTNEQKVELRKIVTANGRSWSNPIYDAAGNEDMDASRRVEIQFRLRDQEAIEEMIGVLQQNTVDPVE